MTFDLERRTSNFLVIFRVGETQGEAFQVGLQGTIFKQRCLILKVSFDLERRKAILDHFEGPGGLPRSRGSISSHSEEGRNLNLSLSD